MTIEYATSENRLIDQAVDCLVLGYFHGARECAQQLQKGSTEARQAGKQVAWFCAVYSGKGRAYAVKQTVRLHPHGLGLGFPELQLLAVESNKAVVSDAVDAVLKVADGQQGSISLLHPTAILEFASLVVDDSPYQALDLVNIALGYSGPYQQLRDVEKLRLLLERLEAPVAFWGQWAWIMGRHLKMSRSRVEILERRLGCKEAKTWAKNQYRQAGDTLTNAMASELPFIRELFEQILDATSDDYEFLGGRSQAPERRLNPSELTSVWTSTASQRYRYYWWRLLREQERDMLHNGDWAMVETPTSDYSMALAQWWRLLESILHRVVVRKLQRAYSKHPEWEEADRGLSNRLKEKEQVFFKVAHGNNLSLGEMLILLQKCLAPTRGETQLTLRREGQKFLETVLPTLSSIVDSAPTTQTVLRFGNRAIDPLLTQQAIRKFRNRASHLGRVSDVEASIGRAHVIGLLNELFTPVYESELIPRIGEGGIQIE